VLVVNKNQLSKFQN